MVVITRWAKHTVDLPISSSVEDEKRGYDEAVEYSGELVHISGKEAEIPQKMSAIPRQHLHSNKDW